MLQFPADGRFRAVAGVDLRPRWQPGQGGQGGVQLLRIAGGQVGPPDAVPEKSVAGK